MWPQGTMHSENNEWQLSGGPLYSVKASPESPIQQRKLHYSVPGGSFIIQSWEAPSLFSAQWLQALNEQFWFL